MRAVHNVRIEDCVHQVLHNQWKIKQPRIVVLIISNVGPLRDWTNAHQRKKFQKGVMKVTNHMFIIRIDMNLFVSKFDS